MPSRRPPSASRSRCRGGAAVEVMLSITFLFVSIIAMLDLTRMSSALARSHGPARSAAWHHARLQDDTPGFDSSGAVQDISLNVYQWTGGDPPDGALETGESGSGSSDWSWAPEGVIGHILGKVQVSTATLTSKPTGLMMFPTTDVKATHTVFLKSDREHPWDGEKGWFDPVMWFNDILVNLFDNLEDLLPTWEDIPGMLLDLVIPGGFGDIFDVPDSGPGADESGFGD